MSKVEATQTDWCRIDFVPPFPKRGYSIRELSIQAGLKPDTLKNVLSRAYPKAERIIADAIGVDPAQIWPSRYAKQKDTH